MDALEALLEEHEIIWSTIEAMDAEVKEIQGGKKLSQEKFGTILDVIRNFADKCHHGKEEDALFPAVEKKGINESRVVALMLEEHREGRAFVKSLADAVRNSDLEGVAMNANGYSSLLKMHIKKENAVFPLWMKSFSEEMRRDMARKFEEIEKKTIGSKRQEYAGIAAELKKKV